MSDSLPPLRELSVVHETVYRYDRPVERSTHVFRLRPVHDQNQRVMEYDLTVSVAGRRTDFEDLYDNHATHYAVESPYTELRIVSRSRTRLAAPAALAPPPYGRSILPLVWPPSERVVLAPYLEQPEMPRPQLRELADYATSFAERNDYDLLDTLLDMTTSIHRDFEYVPGSTSVETTPYETFMAKRGVCQDYAHLFMYLTRLLDVPSRYRVGYIYAGGNYEHKEQSEASHGWVECYLPWLGWRGFDPTNGRVTGTDHVRVACGRTVREATPTSGTILAGGGGETLAVSVRVEDVAAAPVTTQ